MPAIEVSHLTKEYRLGALQGLKQTLLNTGARLAGRPVPERPLFKALDDVSFTIEQGEVVGIIGHNGAGKSTLLKTLARVTTPSSGSVKVNGRIAPLIEVGAGFVPDFTGRENVYLNGAILGMSRQEIDRKFDEIVDFAEMSEFIDTPVKRYSSGMQVRLAFAVATSVESDILIVDEVLAVGDLSFQQKCIDRMDTLIRREGRTVLVVSHNIRQIERLCSRVMLLDHGRLVQTGSPRDVCGAFFRIAQEHNLALHQPQNGIIEPQRDAGVITVRSIEAVDKTGKAVNSVRLHDPLTLRVRFHCNRLISKPEVIVGFHTSDFVHLLSVSSAMLEERPDFGVGDHEISCHFSDIPLRPFTYGIRLIFVDRMNATLWYGENLAALTITPGDLDITKFPTTGLVHMPSTWQFERQIPIATANA
ncbi:ABC transporter ATP-binding protein [Thauera sp. WH-1]|uniref:ABC transporter ATP-binding protein n=1 Tax=Thauera sp. WH-1 TaxID=3398230 RepID=UPI0039FBE7E0